MNKSILLAAALLLSGCGVIYPDGISEAEKLCENNGGISHIQVWIAVYPDVYCNNGAVFEDVGREK